VAAAPRWRPAVVARARSPLYAGTFRRAPCSLPPAPLCPGQPHRPGRAGTEPFMSTAMHYFRWAFLFTAAGLALAFWLGWGYGHGLAGATSFFLIGVVLAILEISLSFDNAIVNANKLEQMTPVWQHRFLTWGILIAVFGMRIIFPLLIVVVAAGIGPFAALRLAAFRPDEYAEIIAEAHLPIAAFGGTFLMMVALRYFIDEGKEVDWIRALECRLRRCASIRGLEIAFVLAVVMIFASVLPDEEVDRFLFASVSGLLTFLAVEVLGPG